MSQGIRVGQRWLGAAASVLVLSLSLSVAGPARALSIGADWNGGTGDWSDANWTFSVAPTAATFPDNDAGNNEFFNASVLTSGDTVTVDGDYEIDSLNIGANSQVTVGAGNSLTIAQDAGRPLSGAIQNGGGVDLASSAAQSAQLLIPGNVSLTGGGTVQLSGPANTVVFGNDDAPQALRGDSRVAGSGTLSNQDNTIEGTGLFGSTALTIRNEAGGTVDANVAGASLVMLGNNPGGIGGAGMTNLGTMQASDGGILRLFFGTYEQSEGGADEGTIQALAGSRLQIENSNAAINGGILRTVDDGEVVIRRSDVTLNDVDVSNSSAGSFLITDNAAGIPSLFSLVGGSLINDNTITVVDSTLDLNGLTAQNTGKIELASQGGVATMQVDNAVGLTGGGTVRLSGPTTEVVFAGDDAPQAMRSRSRIIGTGTLSNQDNTIEGTGFFGSTALTIRNEAGGTIDANVAGGSLVTLGNNPGGIGGAGMTNLGTMQASNGGILRLFFGTYEQSEGGADQGTMQALAGSRLQIESSNAAINGGILRTVDSGEVVIRGSSVTLNDVDVSNSAAGSFLITANSVGATSNVTMNGGTMVNAGSVQVVRSNIQGSGAYRQSSGQTVLDDASLELASFDIDGGVLTGNGSINAPATIAGTVAPGLSSGRLDFVGGFEMSGIYEVELGGVGAGGIAYDLIDVIGTATLLAGAMLDILLVDQFNNPGAGAFVPTLGDFFDVLVADTLVLDPLQLVLSYAGLGGGLELRASIASLIDRSALRLTVVRAQGVSEPGALSLFLVALPFMLWASRRRPRTA